MTGFLCAIEAERLTMTKDDGLSFEHGNRPEAISAPTRHSKHGTVVEEVGVFENGSGSRNYWKVLQRIEGDDGQTRVRPGYYAGSGDDWDWAQDPLILPADVYNELHGRVITEGILRD
jgi:hypothetical protein